MAVRTVSVLFDNQTDSTLNKIRDRLDHGKWTVRPPDVVAPHDRATWKSESAGFATGTEGWAEYEIADGGKVVVRWNNPFVGDNSFGETFPEGWMVAHEGGGGNRASVTFTLWDKRPKPLPPDTPITNLQILVVTADAANAGTNNSVWFDIGPYGWKLSSSTNDFERGDRRIYPLPLPESPRLNLEDIVRLRLEKKGIFGWRGAPDGLDGGWLPKEVVLIVNGKPYIASTVDTWLTRTNPEWLLNVNPALSAAERFVRSLRVVPNGHLNLFDRAIGGLTNQFKNFGVSGWISQSLPVTRVTGKIIRSTQSTDFFRTIDLELETIDVGGQVFTLDGVHGIPHQRYIRVEWLHPWIIPIPLPDLNRGGRIGVTGVVTWDTDQEGWFEIHPRNDNDVTVL